MKREDRFPSNPKWLKAANCAEPITLQISSIDQEELSPSGGDTTAETILSFRNEHRRLILNVTIWKQVAELHGDDDAEWVGKLIEVFPTECDFKGENVPCLRVREASAKADEASIPF